ncbi:orc1/cdc6 family replication initiation protein [Haloferax sp. DFSO52]|uniref:orc1/cdc6 family replication initiation protein n=1 Tax=Haloferax sp. DFSO52 TaxID=3388505 RepID=UPI003A875FFB
MTTGNDGEGDPLFTSIDPIFARKQLLKIGHIPEADRIVGRDEEIRKLASALNPAVFGHSPNNVLIYGKTGTGKSLCARHVTKRCREVASNQDVNVGLAFIDCSQQTTETQAIRKIGKILNDEDATSVSIPESGLSTAQYYDRFWKIADSLYDSVIIVLDEIDRIADDNILMQLSRAEEAEKIRDCGLGIIGISNKIDYKERMNERVKSSLQEREYIFAPYDASKLTNIMENRDDAFKDGVLEEGVISLCAALAAQEHGDARKAIDIFRHAGEIAFEEESSTVGERHVRAAQELAERDRFRELIAGIPAQAKAALLSLAQLSIHNKQHRFSTSEIFEEYERLSADVNLERLSERRVYDLLKEQAFLGVIEMNRTGGGRGQGSYMEHHLVEEPTIVRAVLQEDPRFNDLTYRDRTHFKLW